MGEHTLIGAREIKNEDGTQDVVISVPPLQITGKQ